MLYAHVNPGFDPTPHSGVMLYLDMVLVDILSRTSVATLSFVSGFLLAYGVTRKDAGALIWGRIQALYLPMLVWSAIFIAAALGGSILLGYTTETSRALAGLPTHRLIAEKLMFLYGAPASQALGFLRDLTASSILLILLLRIPGKVIIGCALLVVFGFALFGTMAPVVYRPTIPLFMLAGAAFYRGCGNLHVPPIYAIFAAFLFAVLVVRELSALTAAGDVPSSALAANAANIAKRTILTVLALTLGSMLVTTRVGAWLSGISDGVFLTYLCHTIVISVFWAVWKRVVGDETHSAYLLFFLASPVLVMSLATRLGPTLDRLPRAIQIGLRGKARTPAIHAPLSVRGAPKI